MQPQQHCLQGCVLNLPCHAAARCCPLLPTAQEVKVDEIRGAAEAKQAVEEAIQMYVDAYVPKAYRVAK